MAIPGGTAGTSHAILRIGAGLLFMMHGAQKLLGWFGGMGGEGTTAPLFSQMGLASILELVGGALIVLGLFTRPVALILLAEMVVAYFMVHAPRGTWPIENMGEPAVLYGLIFLFLAGNGAGPFSIDATRRRITRKGRLDEEVEHVDVRGEYRTPSMERRPARGTRTREP